MTSNWKYSFQPGFCAGAETLGVCRWYGNAGKPGEFFFNYILVYGNCFFIFLERVSGHVRCDVIKESQAQRGWWQGLLKQGQTNTKVTTQVMSSPFGVSWGNSSSAFTPQSSWSLGPALMFLQTLQKSSSEGSLPTPGVGPRALWVSLSQVRGTAQPQEGTLCTASELLACSWLQRHELRGFQSSALLFIFSNAHKLSTNNLSYQVSAEDWVIMFVVQNEGCQF